MDVYHPGEGRVIGDELRRFPVNLNAPARQHRRWRRCQSFIPNRSGSLARLTTRLCLGAHRMAARGAVPGAWFDAAKADKVVALWPKVFKLTTKRFAGKPFNLRFWQEVIVRLLIGWKVPVEIIDEVTGNLPVTIFVRLFQELRLWIPRKNGKSEFLAALALLFWALEGEVRGQGFASRTTRTRRARSSTRSPTWSAMPRRSSRASRSCRSRCGSSSSSRRSG
jgi:hypothetical protein